MSEDYGEPWTRSTPHDDYRNRHGVYVLPGADGKFGERRDRCIKAFNLLAGVPTERLDPSHPATCMFLAWLKGDEVAALAWADEVQAMANVGPEGYQNRGHLLHNQKALLELVKRCLKLSEYSGCGAPIAHDIREALHTLDLEPPHGD